MCLDFISSFENDQPNEEAACDESADTRQKLEYPRPRQVVGVWIVAAHPVVLALQTEGVVRKNHDRHHQKDA